MRCSRLASSALALAAGCGAAATSAATAPASPAPHEAPVAPAADGATPGFVVYVTDGSYAVSLDGTVTPGDGYWVLDDRDAAAPVVSRWAHEPPPDAFACGCERDDACTPSGWTETRFGPTGAPSAFDASGDITRHCPCYAIEEDEDGDDDDECGGVEVPVPPPVALSGGVVYALGARMDNEGCSGARLVDSIGQAHALVAGARRVDEPVVRGACFSRVLDAPGWPEDVLAGAACARESDDDHDDDPCGACERMAGDEATASYVARGQLVRVGTNASVSWELTFVTRAPLTPATCPGPNDPCGTAATFPGVDAYGDFWVATGGEAALVARDGDAWIWPRGGEAVAIALPVQDILGLRFHADLRPLLAPMRAGTPDDEALAPFVSPAACALPESPDEGPALAPEDQAFVDTHGGRDWGNRCFEHVRAGALDAAEAACERGLDLATEPSVQGALYYNFGRIAEARGDAAEARSWYERSLASRPGNRTVQQRLDALR